MGVRAFFTQSVFLLPFAPHDKQFLSVDLCTHTRCESERLKDLFLLIVVSPFAAETEGVEVRMTEGKKNAALPVVQVVDVRDCLGGRNMVLR